jgi:hypothetical protein
MLSQTSREEIIRKIESRTGYLIEEEKLSPATRQAITNLATIQRHLLVITELLRGEQSRIDRSLLLRVASRLGEDSEKAEKAKMMDEIKNLQLEIDNKIPDIAKQIQDEETARQSGLALPEYKGKLEMVELKCPSCGASLPLPTSHLFQCQYCKNTFAVQDISSQLKSMIQNI